MPRWSVFVALVMTMSVPTVAVAQDACPPPASTFETIQRGIFEQHSCTFSYCHGASADAGLDLRAGNAYASLVRDPTHDDEAGERDGEIVDPGHPEESLLWQALAAKTLRLRNLPAVPMPIGALPISRDELEGVRQWILAGAPETGIIDGVSDLIQACRPAPPEDGTVPPACAAGEPDLLLPDLVPDPPKDVRMLYRDGHRIIEFTTSIANDGDGPLIVQAAERPTGPAQSLDAVQIIQKTDGSSCSRSAGHILYEIDGKKWSYGNMADFELRKDDPLSGPVLARASKAVFCLLDTDPISSTQNLPHQFEAHCEDDIGRMGISVGYKDLYHRVLPGQWIDLDADPSTAVNPGTYYLVNVVDPTGTLSESDASRSGNTSFTRVSVRLPDPDAPSVRPPARQPHAPNPPQSVHGARPPRVSRNPHAPHSPHRPSAADRPTHASGL